MTSRALQASDVNAYQPLSPIGPGPRPIVVRPAKGRKAKVNPRDSWPRWTAFTVISTVEDDEYRPSVEEPYIPSKDEETEWEKIMPRAGDGREPRETDGYAPGYYS